MEFDYEDLLITGLVKLADKLKISYPKDIKREELLKLLKEEEAKLTSMKTLLSTNSHGLTKSSNSTTKKF